MIAQAFAVGAALIGTVVSCEANQDGGVDVVVGNHYLIEDGVPFEGDLVHGDQLDVILDPEGAVERCDWMGGTLVPSDQHKAPTGRPVCVKVDF